MSSAPSYPPVEPHRIMTSTARAFTEPASRIITSMIGGHGMDDFDDLPEKKHTQAEQDQEDAKARKRAMRNLVNTWQERLQLISTTFFASTEAAMLVNTRPGNPNDLANNILQVSNACLLGALIVHVYASVLSFFGAFLLISYKLREATREEMIIEGIPVTTSPLGAPVIGDIERGIQRIPTNSDAQSMTQKSVQERKKKNGLAAVRPRIFSSNPHVELVGLFKSRVSSHQLLSRTHTLCVLLAGAGFILSIVGVLCYSWSLQPLAVSIFASACLGGALLSMFALRI